MSASKLYYDDDGRVVVYTDGSCLNNGTHYARAGIGVWFSKRSTMNASERVEGRQTSNVAEIQAARRAIEIAFDNNMDELAIFTDSNQVVLGMNEWLYHWKVNNWYTRTGKPVKNRDEYQLLDEARDQMDEVTFNWVPGHRGNMGNEAANKLAERAAANF